MENKIVIYKTKGNKAELKIRLEKETIWLTQKQIAGLFNIERSVITKHIRNILGSGELEEKSNVQKMHIAGSDKPVKFYNLDMIISVGYRVNSQKATQFRIWATNVLRKYIVKGVAINQKRLKEARLQELEGAIKLLKTVQSKKLSQSEAEGLLNVITEYADSWLLLEKYDKGDLKRKGQTKKILKSIEYDFAKEAVEKLKKDLLKKKEAKDIFGQERDKGLESILGNLKQSFGGKSVYPSIEERAAHLLYFVIKNHPFVDGNKRIGSFLFIVFLSQNNYLLDKKGEKKINDNALVAIALLVAESKPSEKDVMLALITNLL